MLQMSEFIWKNSKRRSCLKLVTNYYTILLTTFKTRVGFATFICKLQDRLLDGSSIVPPSVNRVLNNGGIRTKNGAVMFGDELLPSECSPTLLRYSSRLHYIFNLLMVFNNLDAGATKAYQFTFSKNKKYPPRCTKDDKCFAPWN